MLKPTRVAVAGIVYPRMRAKIRKSGQRDVLLQTSVAEKDHKEAKYSRADYVHQLSLDTRRHPKLDMGLKWQLNVPEILRNHQFRDTFRILKSSRGHTGEYMGPRGDDVESRSHFGSIWGMVLESFGSHF